MVSFLVMDIVRNSALPLGRIANLDFFARWRRFSTLTRH